MPRSTISRQEVIDVAITLVERDGADALGINRVARELKIKPPSLYNHVKGGADLRWAMSIEGNRRLLAYLNTRRPRGTPVAVLKTRAESLRTWARENAAVYNIMATTSVDNDDAEFAAVRDELLGVFLEPLQAMEVPKREAIHALRALRATVHGFIVLERGGQFGSDKNTDASFQRALAWVIGGIEESTQ